MFCASVLIFSGTDDAQSSFHVLPPGLIFGGTKDIGVSFLCFAIPDSFWAVPRASGSVFIFCAFGLIFDSTDGARFSFMFCASGLIFDGIEGAGSQFYFLRSRTHFGRYQGHQSRFLICALLNSIWAVSWASGQVFIFCAVKLIFDSTEGVWSRFQILLFRTRFWRY
jgi:hypothetical protein